MEFINLKSFCLKTYFMRNQGILFSCSPEKSCFANFHILWLKLSNCCPKFSELIRSSVKHQYYRCCSGFCVDLVQKFSEDLSFDFQLVRVKDGKWGGVVNGKWNGLVAELINHETGTLTPM